MAKKYDLVVKTGEFTDRDGATKGRFMNVGVMMEGRDGGPYILLNRTFNPAGVPGNADRDNIMVSLYEPRDQAGGGQQRRSAPAEVDDEIPY